MPGLLFCHRHVNFLFNSPHLQHRSSPNENCSSLDFLVTLVPLGQVAAEAWQPYCSTPFENENEFRKGSRSARNLFRSFTVFLVFCFAALGAAFGQCAAPSADGVRICFPNEGSAVTYVPPMEMSATTRSGAISKVQIWDNGKLRDNFAFFPARCMTAR